MINRPTILCTTVALFALSCSSTAPPGATSKNPSVDAKAEAPPRRAERNGPQAKPVAIAGPVAPVDARMTLYCMAVDGISHVDLAKKLKEQFVQQTGWTDFYLVHGEDQSTLYYGYYKDFTGNKNGAEKQRAEADRQKIVSVADRLGTRPFRGAMFVDLNTPDPAGPPEWNLSNTPADRMWSLQIAAYKDSPLRKQYAVDAVREARKQGVDAYYYHGETVSSVCVGAFPREALREQESGSAQTYNSDQPIVVLPTPLPAGASEDVYVRDDQGRKVKAKAMAPRVEPTDAKLIAAMKTYPRHSLNGEEIVTISKNPRTGRELRAYDPSFIVEIKHANGVLAGLARPDAGPVGAVPVSPRPQSGPGQLRGLGDQ